MTDTGCNDDRLKTGLGRGERWAYETMFMAYGRMVSKTIASHARHLSGSELADEVHDVFVSVLSQRIDVRTSITGYLRRAALNHCASRARHWEFVSRASAQLRALSGPDAEAVATFAGESGVDAERVRRFLDQCPDERMVYEMVYVDEIGRHEIMRRTGWTERYARARIKQLHDALGNYLRSTPRRRGSFATGMTHETGGGR